MTTGRVTGREYKRTRVRGYAPWNPKPATLGLIETVRRIIAEYPLALTIRQVFYRLVGAHGYEKTERAYNNLGEALNRARRAGGDRLGCDPRRHGGTVPPRAVTEDQAEEFALASAPQKPIDRRGEYMAETHQAEALDPANLAEIVRERLATLIPLEVTDAAEAQGDRERAELLALITAL